MPPDSKEPTTAMNEPQTQLNSLAAEHTPVEENLATTLGSTTTIKKAHSKKPLLIIGGVVVVALVATGTVYILSQVALKDEQTTSTQTPQQQAADLAKQANDAATASANKGDTQGALDHYKEALVQYQKAGDKAGEEGVKLQIQYYEMVKANEEKAKAAADQSNSSQ